MRGSVRMRGKTEWEHNEGEEDNDETKRRRQADGCSLMRTAWKRTLQSGRPMRTVTLMITTIVEDYLGNGLKVKAPPPSSSLLSRLPQSLYMDGRGDTPDPELVENRGPKTEDPGAKIQDR